MRDGVATECAPKGPSRNRPPGMTATTLCVPETGPVFVAVAPPVQTMSRPWQAWDGERPLATEAQRLSVRPTFALSVCCAHSHGKIRKSRS
jgi:hypothetical protein